MWAEIGNIVVYYRGDQKIIGRVVNKLHRAPRCVVRSVALDPRPGEFFDSEKVHYDDLRHASETEVSEFLKASSQSVAPAKKTV